MRKEILLKNLPRLAFFTTKSRSKFRIIRMYDYPTCEISLLQLQDSAVWKTPAAMRELQENLVDPA